MLAKSIAESFMSWLERESDQRAGATRDQVALLLLAAKARDLGMLSTNEYLYLDRRIASNG